MSKFTLLTVLSTAILLSACGDSSTTKEPEPPVSTTPPTTAPVTTNTTGVITGFGSVFVNGVEYETDNSQVSTDDDDSASETDLQVGMVVTLSGTVNDDGTTGDASKIHYEEQLKGPLESIDLIANTMTVLGQNITFDDLTSLERVVLVELNLGDFLEISGFFDNEGNLYASRIEKEDNVTTLKVQGKISMLDANAQTFKLAQLTINYSGATFDDFTAQDLADDLAVRVKGDASALVDNVFSISKIKPAKKEDDHNDGDKRHLEGIISTFESNANFVVNDITVITDDNTKYEHGTAESLALDVRVKIKGSFNEAGQLLAKEIRIHQRSELKIEGLVQATDLELKTLTVLEVVFQVSEQTKMEDESDNDERFFDLADLVVGDFVEIKGFVDNDSNHIATKLERKNLNDDDGTELKGPVSDINDFTFMVVGVTVHTTENTLFEDKNGDDVNQGQFFEQLIADMHVEVKGQLLDEVFTATKVEVKERDNDEHEGEHRTEFRGTIETLADTSFVVSGHTVNFNDATKYEVNDELLAAEQFWALAKIGDQVKIKGSIDDEEIITAKSIELEIDHQDNVAKADIEGVGSLLEESLTVVNHTIEFDQHTIFESLTGPINMETFLTQAIEWQFFKVKGTLRENVLFARKIEQREASDDRDDVELSAFVEMSLDNGVVVAGHTANFTDDTQFMLNGAMITKAEFFTHLSENKKVELEGKLLFEEQEIGTPLESITVSVIAFR
jgi:hypothetical protein